ncbi:hypothetical protein Glove_245g7 [Diversispora epigaea]|uniref:Uncharacterized protein n=1 Tax=Diversispora epigaea TaxID=1348612 RepID=A0A397ID11_9GLOM|nr:hypothetical protein Glove_245g7 [Diversispora epigaea]
MSRESTKTKVISSPQEICEAYKENFNACLSEINPEPLPVKILLEPVTILTKKIASEWKDCDVMPLAKILAGRIAIDGSGENREYPPIGSPHATITPFRSKHVFTFNSPRATDDAQHLIEWLQGTNPGIRAYMFHTGFPAILY